MRGRSIPTGDSGQAAVARPAKSRAAKQLELFALRCLEIADRVAAGEVAFLDGIDLLYEAARWGGLVESVGDDIIQGTMAAAFANARRP
jgi:hypothetical protein